MKERIQKLLAQANIASRRNAEEYIEKGRVRVNGVIAKLGEKADPINDVIELDGEKLKFNQKPIYIAVNKPRNVLVTHKAHHTDERETIIDMIGRRERLFPIGRLDADSEGLVVLTNDGDLAQKLTHPSFRHTKTYKVDVYGIPEADALEKWRNGIYIDDERTAPCFVELLKSIQGISTLEIVMIEGKKRQIRRVANALGFPVRKLVRTHIGTLELGDLAPGRSRELTDDEIKLLQQPAPQLKQIASKSARRRLQSDNASRRPRVRRDDEGEVEDRPRRSSLSRFRHEAERDEQSASPRIYRDDDERPRRKPAPRQEVEGAPRMDRPPRPRRDSDSSDRPRREGSSSTDRPRFPRRDSTSSDRPRREGSSSTDRPRFPRRDSASSDRPRRPRPDSASSDRPRREGDSSDRPRREGSSSTDRPRFPRRDSTSSDRPRREGSSSTDRPRFPRRDSTSSDRPRREGDSSDRPRREGDSSDRPRRPRPDSTSSDRPRREGDSSDRPRRPSTGTPPRRDDNASRPRRSTTSRPPRRDNNTAPRTPRKRRDDDAE